MSTQKITDNGSLGSRKRLIASLRSRMTLWFEVFGLKLVALEREASLEALPESLPKVLLRDSQLEALLTTATAMTPWVVKYKADSMACLRLTQKPMVRLPGYLSQLLKLIHGVFVWRGWFQDLPQGTHH